ncbi:MAG: potassium channel family protein [Halioglobus sp.]
MASQKIHEKNNFVYLTLALLVLMATAAISTHMSEVRYGRWIVTAVSMGTLLVAYLSLNFNSAWRNIVLVLLAALLLTTLLGEINHQFSTALPIAIILLIFFCGEAYLAGSKVLFSGSVDANKIIGSLALYLLIGLVYAMIYLIMLELNHDAFNGIDYIEGGDNFATVNYFSFVTMTSLGYGDISPREPVGRVIVIFESISGAFYMAVVVASMIGARTGKSSD